MFHLAIISLVFFITTCIADNPPCPLLGPNFPLPTGLSTSPIVAAGINSLKEKLESSIATGNSSNGPTTPNTTSFSIGLFSTENTNSSTPFLWQYHHTAPSLSNSTSNHGVNQVNESSVYRIGTLSQLLTVYAFLIQAGDTHWSDRVTKWVPELAEAAKTFSAKDEPLKCVDWSSVTLGQLAGHMSGIARDYAIGDLSTSGLPLTEYGLPPLGLSETPACGREHACNRTEFFAGFIHRAPVYLSDTTPSFSNAGFQILAYALEAIAGKPFSSILEDSLFNPLGMEMSSLSTPPAMQFGVIPGNSSVVGWNLSSGEDAALSIYSNLDDLAVLGSSILSSSLLPPSEIHGWLKPVSLTSNLVNSQGRPWEIYSAVADPVSPVTEIYTVLGSIGHYSSYFGLVPAYGVGFALLAADSEGIADLNAYVDFISEAILPALGKAAISQAKDSYEGTYVVEDISLNSTMTILIDGLPGLSITSLISNGTDFRSSIAKLNGIRPEALIFRLYPTNLYSDGEMTFRAIWQDNDDIADAGTPTCVSWMNLEELVYGGQSLDEFVFQLGVDRKAASVNIPALRITLIKQ